MINFYDSDRQARSQTEQTQKRTRARAAGKLLWISIAALGALLATAVLPADAADIYSGGGFKDQPILVPIQTWAGFYIGGNIGAAWTNLDTDNFAFCSSKVPCKEPVAFTNSGNTNSVGAFGGVQGGYNFQRGNFVFGVELDLGGMAVEDRRLLLATTPMRRYSPATTTIVSLKEDGGFYGDITGRLGYAWGNLLLYAKGGFAWLNSDFKASETVIKYGVATSFSDNNNNTTLTGWTAGAGFEYQLNPNWSMKVEYLHFDFGDDNICCGDQFGNVFRNDHDLTADTVKLGFNYYLHPVVAALPYK